MNVKRAHMVSKSYLRAWADKRGCVDVIDLEHSRRLTTAIGNATVVSYAYDPEVLTIGLEEHFGKIESAAAPAFKQLRDETPPTRAGQRDIIAFLDMHLERGRYADQAKVTIPAIVLRTNGDTEETELKLGDRLVLSRYMKGPITLSDLGLEDRPWRVYDGQNLITGDGAVICWGEKKDRSPSTVTFPISPTQLLVIGREINVNLRVNEAVRAKSRRWLVGSVGSLTNIR